MAQAILTHRVGNEIVDLRNTKSSISLLAPFCDDLVGCGSSTHIRYRGNGSLKARNNCSPLQEYLSYSISGLTDIRRPSSEILQFVSPVVQYMVTAITANAPVVSPDGDLGGTYEWRAGEWVKEDPTGNRDSISALRAVPLLDQCDVELGFKYSITRTQYIPDPDTCKPDLRHQVSLSVFAATSPNIYNVNELVGDLLLKPGFGLTDQYAVLPADLSQVCVNTQQLFLDMLAAFPLPYTLSTQS